MSEPPVTYPDQLEIIPLAKPPLATIRVPGSKSITNRALVLAALSAKGFACALRGALRSEDTEVMIEALRSLGFRVLADWQDCVISVDSDPGGRTIPAPEATLFVANSGTTMRFLTALVGLGQGRYRLDGVARMRQRPIQDLLDALEQLGVSARSENADGCPPVVIASDGLQDEGTVRIKGDVSSQFLSGLIMMASYAPAPIAIEVVGKLVSRPYVEMTLKVVRQFGGLVLEHWDPIRFEFTGRSRAAGRRGIVPGMEPRLAPFHEGHDPRRHHTELREYQIEPDASAASYFWGAAAISEGHLSVPGLSRKSLQGDVSFVELLEEMGCEADEAKDELTVHGGPLRGIDIDMNAISDTVMTLAAVACFAEGPTTIRNVAHIRHKETDRLAALATELRKVGAEVEEYPDGLKITPRPLHGAVIETYNDHRMAMSMALIGLKVPGIVIKNPACVAKTYPGFFQDLEKLRL